MFHKVNANRTHFLKEIKEKLIFMLQIHSLIHQWTNQEFSNFNKNKYSLTLQLHLPTRYSQIIIFIQDKNSNARLVRPALAPYR